MEIEIGEEKKTESEQGTIYEEFDKGIHLVRDERLGHCDLMLVADKDMPVFFLTKDVIGSLFCLRDTSLKEFSRNYHYVRKVDDDELTIRIG